MTKYRKGGVYIVRHILETFEKYEYLLIRPQGDCRLKPDLKIADVSHTNYKFSCDCNLTYIGESRLRLESRVNQHRTSKSSAIFQHIQTCTHYADSLNQNFSDQPSDSELRKHLFSHFKILTKNRYSAPSRKLSEGLFITKSQPELNRQVVHKKCLLLCSCPDIPQFITFRPYQNTFLFLKVSRICRTI